MPFVANLIAPCTEGVMLTLRGKPPMTSGKVASGTTAVVGQAGTTSPLTPAAVCLSRAEVTATGLGLNHPSSVTASRPVLAVEHLDHGASGRLPNCARWRYGG
ncbi:hypothetical protein FMEAI12_2840069 [Parafrankia sp. Ea1.12]|nr:hypothetical protein FMEAI12_2840069 [Parafrankia sp. Ea1.12]